MFRKSVTCLSFILLFSACGSRSINVDFHLPTHQFLTPETTGEALGVKGSINAHHAHKVSLARTSQSSNVFSSDPGSIDLQTDPKGDNSFGVGLNGAVGIWDRIDLLINKSNEAPWQGGLQVQVLGSPDRKTLGLKLSIAGYAGYQSDREVASDDFGSSSSESDKF
ncbi:MAG: hypothetical protein HN509_13050, partial [Halobacteriovoraceae bacterium]|nr:hypothetical protein [Halobacteriovoraceae bacterium]